MAEQMDYEAVVGVLERFERKYPLIKDSPNTNGLRIALIDGDYVIKLAVYRKLPPQDVPHGELMPPMFEDGGRIYKTKVVETKAPTFLSGAYAGDKVFARNFSARAGTIGWSFAVRTKSVRSPYVIYFVSNWHVLRGTNKLDDKPNTPQELLMALVQGQASVTAADLTEHYEPIYESGDNYWDYALGQYRPGVEVHGAFSVGGCATGYPMDLSSGAVLGDAFCKIGFSTKCTKGTLYEIGTTDVDDGGTKYRFKNQLFFRDKDKNSMTIAGDSGSVMVRDAKPATVTGLAFASLNTSPGYTVANPLWARGWRKTGEYNLGNGEFLPIIELRPKTLKIKYIANKKKFRKPVFPQPPPVTAV